MRRLHPHPRVGLVGVTSAALICASAAHAPAQAPPGVPDPDETEQAQNLEEDEEDAEIVTGGTVGTVARPLNGAMRSTAARTETISSDVLVRRGATDLAQALEWLGSGASVSPTGTAQGMLVDGLPTSQLTVLRDGVPLARPAGSPQGPIVDLSAIAIDPSTIERIDVYRGAGPPGSGGAGGIIIDIVTRQETGPARAFARGQAVSGPSDLLRQELSLGASAPIGERAQVRLLGMGASREALDIDGDLAPDTPQIERLYGEASLIWRPRERDRIQLTVMHTDSETLSLSGPRAPLDDRVTRENTRVRAGGRWWLGRDVRLDHLTDLGRQTHDFDKLVRSSGFERQLAITETLEARQSVAATWFLPSHDLAAEIVGGGWRVARDGAAGDFAPVGQADVGAGLTDTWYLAEKLELYGRAWGEASTLFGPGLNAQVGTVWAPAERWRVRGSLARSRRVPTPEELYLSFDHSEVGYQVQGNPELDPEQLQSARGGVMWKWRNLGLEAEGFYHDLSDVIVTVDTPGMAGLFSYGNVGEAHSAGTNASAQLRALPGGLSLLANYTWLPLASARGSQERLPLRPRHAGRAELRGAWLGGNLEAWCDVNARAPVQAPDGSGQVSSYALVGLGAGYRWGPWARLIVDANNLLDQTDPTWGPAPGFNLMTTLQLGVAAQGGWGGR